MSSDYRQCLDDYYQLYWEEDPPTGMIILGGMGHGSSGVVVPEETPNRGDYHTVPRPWSVKERFVPVLLLLNAYNRTGLITQMAELDNTAYLRKEYQ